FEHRTVSIYRSAIDTICIEPYRVISNVSTHDTLSTNGRLKSEKKNRSRSVNREHFATRGIFVNRGGAKVTSLERRVAGKGVSKILLFGTHIWTQLLVRVSPRASRMTQNGKLMPNLDQQSTKILNLTVLQRIDPFVEEILMTAAHVTLYEFNIELNQWVRLDREPLLPPPSILNTQPRFQFIVMNRRNTDNLVEDLLGDFEYEVQVPYLLYRNAAQEVNGIWFYNSHDCESVANLFSRILNAYSKVPPKPKVASKSEFEELEAVPTSSVIEGPLEPTATSAATSITDVPDDSFVNYFSVCISARVSSCNFYST
ncbi:hypothetical protein BHE74_00035737, partial [Ensete ventricosum]